MKCLTPSSPALHNVIYESSITSSFLLESRLMSLVMRPCRKGWASWPTTLTEALLSNCSATKLALAPVEAEKSLSPNSFVVEADVFVEHAKARRNFRRNISLKIIMIKFYLKSFFTSSSLLLSNVILLLYFKIWFLQIRTRMDLQLKDQNISISHHAWDYGAILIWRHAKRREGG